MKKPLLSLYLLSAVLFTALVTLAACGQEDDSTKEKSTTECQNRKVIKEVTDQEAKLEYNTKFEAYTLSYLPANAIESRTLGLICNPDKERLDPLIGEVRFSGSLRDIEKDIPPVLGTDYYYAQLQDIRKTNTREMLEILCIGDQTHKHGNGDCPEGKKIGVIENLQATFSISTDAKGATFWITVSSTYDCQLTFEVCDQSVITNDMLQGQKFLISGDIYPYTGKDLPDIGGHYIYTIDNLTFKKLQ